ncbi:MerR family transcriptional regulator [Plantibacter sp. RU18]|uniref:MerR family transcriptional regulator n=1 Tax=Plantibacter sp. RU18 TaxID=3158143 RepID=UPI003D36520F
MLKIGEFAGVTGLSVKALRHYDERGVLAPAEIDVHSGYRKYSEGQVRSAVVARALREAGVPLPLVATAVMSESGREALAAHRARVLEARAREDRAFHDADAELRALTAPVTVTERRLDAQPFVGRVLDIGNSDDDSWSDDDGNVLFGELFARLQRDGAGPSGTFWTSIRADDRGTVQLALCWPTTVELSPDWGGDHTLVDILPARTELVATWLPQNGEALPEGAVSPAVVALFDALHQRGLTFDSTEVRQAALGTNEGDQGVEVCISI